MGIRSRAQLALFLVGLLVWAYGIRADDDRLRWIGIGFFGAAALLRLLRRFERKSDV
jgi:hypothetical protein